MRTLITLRARAFLMTERGCGCISYKQLISGADLSLPGSVLALGGQTNSLQQLARSENDARCHLQVLCLQVVAYPQLVADNAHAHAGGAVDVNVRGGCPS